MIYILYIFWIQYSLFESRISNMENPKYLIPIFILIFLVRLDWRTGWTSPNWRL